MKHDITFLSNTGAYLSDYFVIPEYTNFQFLFCLTRLLIAIIHFSNMKTSLNVITTMTFWYPSHRFLVGNIVQKISSYSYNKMNQMHQFLKFIFGIKLYMLRTVPLFIIRSFSVYTQQWYMSYRFADSLQAGSEWKLEHLVGFITRK